MIDPTEARERLVRKIGRLWPPTYWARNILNAVLEETDDLAALLDPATMLAEWARAGRLEGLIEVAARELLLHKLQITDCDCNSPGRHFHWRCTCDLWHTVDVLGLEWNEHLARVVFDAATTPTPTEEAPNDRS